MFEEIVEFILKNDLSECFIEIIKNYNEFGKEEVYCFKFDEFINNKELLNDKFILLIVCNNVCLCCFKY